jgi:hypothetical protein
VFRNNVEGHYGQIGAGYLFDLSFQEAYLENGVDCYNDILEEVPSACWQVFYSVNQTNESRSSTEVVISN